MIVLQCADVGLTWSGRRGATTEALRGVSFEVQAGEFVGVLGASGSGKSSLLQVLSGLLQPTSGTVLLDGARLTGPTPRVGMIPQDSCLYPWMTIQKNVEFGPKMLGRPSAVRRHAAEKILEAVGLRDWARRYPHELSGGMAQRAALARAMVNDPEVILMDEPFAALDLQTRFLMGQFLLDVWSEFRKTIICVSHSVDEMILLCSRVLVIGSRPGTVICEVAIDLDQPRDPTTPSFNEYRSLLIRAIEEEVMRSFAIPTRASGSNAMTRLAFRDPP